MNDLNLIKVKNYFQRNFIFILLFCAILLLELLGFNHRFFVNTFFQLNEQELHIQDGTLFGFDEVNGALVSEHNDPNLTFRNIDQRVRYVRIKCSNENEDALSQLFFRRVDEDFSEENSILFSLVGSEVLVSLPKTINVTSLRFDLTNKQGDTVLCQGITLNPGTSFNFSYLRAFLFLLGIIGLLFGDKILSPKISESIWNALISNGIWVFAFLLFLIHFAYPVTITFDSAHFLWLANHINTGNWASWDPIRNVGYPLQLFLSNLIFGYRQVALLFPMILAHVLLFIFSCQMALTVLKPQKEQTRFLIYLTLFIVIGLDPTIVGYFHVLLTEYLAATIAVISCFMALKIYQSPVPSKRFYLLSVYFLFFVPISWHLKQPYIGAAYFPLFLTCILLVLRKFSANTILHVLIVNVVILAVVFATASAWENFLEAQENPMDEDRQFSTVAETRIDRRVNNFLDDPLQMAKVHVFQYLASTNYLRMMPSGEWGEPGLTNSFQNLMLAHRMFLNPGSSNKLYEYPKYDPYTRAYRDYYAPPNWLNTFFQLRINLSNFLFTTSYLVLPLLLLIFMYLWIRKKNLMNSAIIILGGTSFLNAIAHLFGSPIDRYLFLGYPLNLIIIIIVAVELIKILKQNHLLKLIHMKANIHNS